MDDSSNPYQAPTYDAESLLAAPEDFSVPVPATAGLRFANFIIDQIAFYFLYFAFIMGIAVVYGDDGLIWLDQASYFLFASIYFCYFFTMEVAFQRTFGKLITGTKVVGRHGEFPSIGQIIGRTISRLIPFEPFSFTGSIPRGWHDSLSKTYVVKVR